MKRPGAAVFVLVVFGALNLMNMMDGRLEGVRGVTVVRLIGTGMCFGAAIGMAAMWRKRG